MMDGHSSSTCTCACYTNADPIRGGRRSEKELDQFVDGYAGQNRMDSHSTEGNRHPESLFLSAFSLQL